MTIGINERFAVIKVNSRGNAMIGRLQSNYKSIYRHNQASE